MTYEVTWYREGHIIYGRLNGTVTMEEITRANASITILLNQGTPPVHLIVDITAMDAVPTDLNRLKDTMGYRHNPALGWQVLVGINPVARFLASMLAELMKMRVSTLHDALAFLVRQDNTLTGLLDN